MDIIFLRITLRVLAIIMFLANMRIAVKEKNMHSFGGWFCALMMYLGLIIALEP